MTIELDKMLQRVVADMFGGEVGATYSTDPKSPKVQCVELTAGDGGRRVRLRASYWWFDVTVLDLGVSIAAFDEDTRSRRRKPRFAPWHW